MDVVDYPRLDQYRRQHHARYVRYVDQHGLMCQDCGGAGGEIEIISLELGGPWFDCGWCEGTGLVTRWIRGLWLRSMKDYKRAKNDPENILWMI